VKKDRPKNNLQKNGKKEKQATGVHKHTRKDREEFFLDFVIL
jgi:hypothetical protein